MIIAAVLYSSFPENKSKGLKGYGGAARFWEGLAYGLNLIYDETGEYHELWVLAPGESTHGEFVENVIPLSGDKIDFDELLFSLDQIDPDFVIGHHPYCLSGSIVKEYPYVCRVGGYRKRLKKYPFLKNFVTLSFFGARHYGREWPVIYQTCNPSEIEYREDKQDYFLFMSNLTRGFKEKGIVSAINLAIETGVELQIVGPVGGDKTALNRLKKLIKGRKNIKYVGLVSGEEKKEKIAGAKALLYPIDCRCKEMGNTTVIECAWCGTPVITTNVGCMPEYVVDGVTGFICNAREDYIDAIGRIDEIHPNDCWNWADSNFHWKDIAQQYIDLAERVAK